MSAGGIGCRIAHRIGGNMRARLGHKLHGARGGKEQGIGLGQRSKLHTFDREKRGLGDDATSLTEKLSQLTGLGLGPRDKDMGRLRRH